MNKPVRIMVFGTFDMVHAGHRNLFMQARKLASNPFLIVSLARGSNVKKIKGNKPWNSEKLRAEQVAKVRGVNKVVLGGINNYLKHILKENPDIIALGYDQTAYVEELKQDLKNLKSKIKVVRLKFYKPHLYKTSILRKIAK